MEEDFKKQIKEMSKKIRKRIDKYSDFKHRLPPEQAEKKIIELSPPNAGITSIEFDEALGEVIIEARKPGLLIGKNGVMLRTIVKATQWRPNIIRKVDTIKKFEKKRRELY